MEKCLAKVSVLCNNPKTRVPILYVLIKEGLKTIIENV